MPIHDYACDCGHRFEALVHGADPACPRCGGAPHRRPSAVRLGGVADPGPGREDAPKSWRTTGGGDPETLRHWHREMTRREKLEEKYPELRGDQRPVLAHEGKYHAKPLRAGDPPASA